MKHLSIYFTFISIFNKDTHSHLLDYTHTLDFIPLLDMKLLNVFEHITHTRSQIYVNKQTPEVMKPVLFTVAIL